MVTPRTNGHVYSPVSYLFDQLMADVARPALARPAAGLLPTADVVETADAFGLHLALPGFRKKDGKLNVEKNNLTVSDERPCPADEKGRFYRVAKSCFRALERTFALPETVNVAGILPPSTWAF